MSRTFLLISSLISISMLIAARMRKDLICSLGKDCLKWVSEHLHSEQRPQMWLLQYCVHCSLYFRSLYHCSLYFRSIYQKQKRNEVNRENTIVESSTHNWRALTHSRLDSSSRTELEGSELDNLTYFHWTGEDAIFPHFLPYYSSSPAQFRFLSFIFSLFFPHFFS